MKLQAIGNSILFQFVDDTQGKYLGLKSKSGILVVAGQADQKEPRWGKVLSVGNRVDEEIKEGLYILIEPLAWTPGLYVTDDERIWRTDDTRVLAVSDEKILSA